MHAKHSPIDKIISIIPADIINLLFMPDEQPTPHDILQTPTAHLETTQISDQPHLKQLTEQCIIEPGHTNTLKDRKHSCSNDRSTLL